MYINLCILAKKGLKTIVNSKDWYGFTYIFLQKNSNEIQDGGVLRLQYLAITQRLLWIIII